MIQYKDEKRKKKKENLERKGKKQRKDSLIGFFSFFRKVYMELYIFVEGRRILYTSTISP